MSSPRPKQSFEFKSWQCSEETQLLPFEGPGNWFGKNNKFEGFPNSGSMEWMREKWRYRLILLLVLNGNRIARTHFPGLCCPVTSEGSRGAQGRSQHAGWRPGLSATRPFPASPLSGPSFPSASCGCPRGLNTVSQPRQEASRPLLLLLPLPR